MAGEVTLSGYVRRVLFRNYEESKVGVLLTDMQILGGNLPRGLGVDDLYRLMYTAPIADAHEGIRLELGGRIARQGPRWVWYTDTCQEHLPQKKEHVRAYILDGGVPYLRDYAASVLLKHYGERALVELEASPEEVARKIDREFNGSMLLSAVEAWHMSRQDQMKVPIFNDLDLTPRERAIICRDLRDRTFQTVADSPYIASYYHGVNFTKVDRQIQESPAKFNLDDFEGYSPRYYAALMHVLNTREAQGHTAVPGVDLLNKAAGLLGSSDEYEVLEKGLKPMLKRGVLRKTETTGRVAYQKPEWGKKEQDFTRELQRLIDNPPRVSCVGAPIVDKSPRGMHEGQSSSVRLALNNHICLITGGPGTGKTTTVNSLVASINAAYVRSIGRKPKIVAMAPSGLAAQRLAEATGLPATTNHSALGIQPGEELTGKAKKIDAEVILLDEATMNDQDIMLAIAKSTPDGARLIILGDVDQLPSISPGNVFADMIACDKLPVGRLTKTFRYSENSILAEYAQSIKMGVVPDFTRTGDDWGFVEKANSKQTAEGVVEQFDRYIKQGASPQDIVVMAPKHGDYNGTVNLNRMIQEYLAAGRNLGFARVGNQIIQEGDMVMSKKNNDRQNISNGQGGICTHASKNYISVDYDGKEVIYYPGNFNNIAPAWVKSIHKMQGSESKFCICPIAMDNKDFYSWQLYYTALTRTKQHVTTIGSKEHAEFVVNNKRNEKRHTGLVSCIQNELNPMPKALRKLNMTHERASLPAGGQAVSPSR